MLNSSLKILTLGVILHVGLGFLMVTESKLQRIYGDNEDDQSVMKFAGINWSLYMSSSEIFEYGL